MEIYLDKRAVRQIRLSAQDAIEEGDMRRCARTFSKRSPRSSRGNRGRLDSGDSSSF